MSMSLPIDRHAALIVRALDHLDTIVLVLGPALPPAPLPCVLAANAAFRRRAPPPAAWTVSEGLASLRAPQTSATTLASIAHAVADGSAFAGEVLLLGLSGPFWLGFSMATVATPDAASRCILIGKDITDQVRRSTEDRATQRLLAAAFSAVGAPVAVVTGGNRIATASQRFAEISGRSPRDLAGQSLDGIVDAEVSHQIHAALADLAPGAPARAFRGSGTRQDGASFSAGFSVAVIDGRASDRLAVLTLHPEEAPESIGKIKLLGLTELKAALGSHWLSVADRAMNLAETTIRRRLGPQDVLSRTSSQAFLIWFERGTAEDNAVVAARIAREVRIVLLTEFADAVVSSVASATVALPPGAKPGQLDGSIEIELDGHKALRPEQVEESARGTLAWAEKTLPVTVEPLYGRNGQKLPASWCSLPREVAAKLHAAATILSRETLGEFEVDVLRLRASIAVAAKAGAQHLPQSCFVALSCECLSHPRSRGAVLELLAGMDATTGARITLLLSGELAHFRPARLHELAAPLKTRVGHLGLAGQTLAAVPLDALTRPFSVVSFSPGLLGGEGAEAGLWQAINAVHRTGSKVVACEVANPTEARKLLELGVDYVCGAAPAPALG
jgi:PAS domain-containing protein